jgi:hypothetical protein
MRRSGLWKASSKSISRIKTMNPMVFPQIQTDHRSFLHFFISGRSESVGDGPWKGREPLASALRSGAFWAASAGRFSCATSTQGGDTFDRL